MRRQDELLYTYLDPPKGSPIKDLMVSIRWYVGSLKELGGAGMYILVHMHMSTWTSKVPKIVAFVP